MDNILGVPTNVVTGFLGSGKTSAIVNFLTQKPADERWAVLINEFGEIGVDGSLVKGQASEANGVFVTEVPGGCMCCATGLPMQMALIQLLRRARPQRLLIEPTGLGHPQEVLQALSGEHYRDVLSLQKTVTLVDARNCSDERYASHPTFLQQLEIADVVVANKEDLYASSDLQALRTLLGQLGKGDADLRVTRQGELRLESLVGAPVRTFAPRQGHTSSTESVPASELPMPAAGYLSAGNSGEGFDSIGWRFGPTKIFNRDRLLAFCSGLPVERLKAVFITEAGVFGYNKTRDALNENTLADCSESRIEIIADSIDPDWESRLLACIEPATER